MKRNVPLFLSGLALWALLAAPVRGDSAEAAQLTEEARRTSVQLLQQIGSEMRREYELSGTLRAVVVCKYTAPEVSSALSRKSGAQVKRVSLRVRNPALGTPDAWEQKILQDFDRRAARGDKAEGIEHSEIVAEPEGRYFRYMKAIPMAPLCLACHGPAESLSEATRGQLQLEYPHDRATGHSLGQVRGAVTYKRPL